jgi:hypothetical protein
MMARTAGRRMMETGQHNPGPTTAAVSNCLQGGRGCKDRDNHAMMTGHHWGTQQQEMAARKPPPPHLPENKEDEVMTMKDTNYKGPPP